MSRASERRRPIRLRRGALALAAAAAMGLAACSSPNADAAKGFGDSGSSGGGGGSNDGPVKIGVVANFSGPVAYLGEGTLAGAQYAADVWNERKPPGLDGRKVELVKCDSQNSDTVALNCITKLTENDSVNALIVDTPAGIAALGPEKTAALKIPVLLSGVQPPSGMQDAPNLVAFGPPIDSSTDPQVLATYLAKAGKKRIATITSQGPYFPELEKAYSDAFTKAGTPVVATEKFTIGDVDMNAQVRNLAKQNVDTIFCAGLGADCAKVAEAIKAQGVKATLAGPITFYMPAFRQLAKDATNDAVFTLPHSKGNDVDPAFVQWLFDYFTRYGFKTFSIGGSTSPEYPGPQFGSYAATDLYLKAALAAKSTDPDKVLTAFRDPKGYSSIADTYTWKQGSPFPTVANPSEPWITRFRDGHISWDLDPRAVPALEDVRIAWENEVFGKKFNNTEEFLLTSIDVFKKELLARQAQIVAAEGQAAFDARIANLDAARQQVESSKAQGKLPELR